jgi:hypothetical protein
MSEQGSVALRVQRMEPSDSAVILALIAAEQSTDGSFSPRQLEEAFLQAGIPTRSKASNQIASLRRLAYVRPAGRLGLWKLTPLGRARTAELLSAMDVAALKAEAVAHRGSVLGGAVHSVVPPFLAPPAIIGPLRDFLAAHPFETNVFGMTRFPNGHPDANDPVAPALKIARAACAAHGLEFHLALDRAIVDDLWANVAAHMWASHFGIAFFEDRMGRGLNYNLNIEVGSMLITGRRCALLKDVSIEKLPTDLVGHIYHTVDLSDLPSVECAIHSWIRDDLSMGACAQCAP